MSEGKGELLYLDSSALVKLSTPLTPIQSDPDPVEWLTRLASLPQPPRRVALP